MEKINSQDITTVPTIIFEDADILIVNKSAGMTVNRADTTTGEETMQDWIERYLRLPSYSSRVSNTYNSDEVFRSRAGIVHRLDKETSGVLIVAKNPESFQDIQSQFKERRVKKVYIALSHGKVVPPEGEIEVPIGRLPWNRKRFGVISDGREAATGYKVLNDTYHIPKTKENLTLLELYPKTGRTHQIRVHLRHINHPIFGDSLYAGRKTSREDRRLLGRVFLHALKISFYHPKSKELLTFESKLPKELIKLLDSLS